MHGSQAPHGARISSPVRAYERSGGDVRGIVATSHNRLKNGSLHSFASSRRRCRGIPTPRTSCLRHSYGATTFRCIKPLNPCFARFFTLPNVFFLDRRTKDTKEFYAQRICSLCSYVLINFCRADAIQLCPYVRGYLTPLNPCSTRIFTSR